MKKIALVFLVLLSGCAKINTEVPDEYRYIEAEYGSRRDLNDFYFIYARSQIKVKIPEVDTMKMGVTRYTIERDNDNVEILVSVIDTNKPLIEGESLIELKPGEHDLNKYITAYDVVDGPLKVHFSKTTFTKPGEDRVIATAVDRNGLETKREFLIYVK